MEILEIIEKSEKELKSSGAFERLEDIAFKNQMKVMSAFRKYKVSEAHFAGTTGYGYDDMGRDTLDKVYADIFECEAAFVRHNIISGTQCLTIGLFGLLRPGDTLLSATGKPYDTLEEVIGIRGEAGNGSLRDFGVKDDQIDWYEARVKRAVTDNAALYVSLPTEQKAEYSELLLPKSLVFMHIPPYEVKVAYDEYVNNGRENTDTVQFVNGTDGEEEPVVFASRTDTELFEKILSLGSTGTVFFGHDHLNNFTVVYHGITLSYGYSIDYLAYDGIADMKEQRGCSVIKVSPTGEVEITHENYYSDKYGTPAEKFRPIESGQNIDYTKQRKCLYEKILRGV
jgi:hypothetical protein